MYVAVFVSEEYVAHVGNVRSLCLSQSSGRLLATGGEDNQINMWSLDKPNCLMVSSSFLSFPFHNFIPSVPVWLHFMI